MSKKNKNKLAIKITITVIILIILVILTIKLIPTFKEIITPQGREIFISQVKENPSKAMLLLFFLEIAQIFLFFFPGEPIEIISGTLFGAFGGFIFILATSTFIYMLIFMLVKKYGKEALFLFIDKSNSEKVHKIIESKVFQDEKYIVYILIVLFLIPGTPKDLIAILAGLFPISYLEYFLIIIFARIPSIITSTIAGKNILEGSFLKAGIYYFGILAIAFIVVLIMIKKDKKGVVKKAIDTIGVANQEESNKEDKE